MIYHVVSKKEWDAAQEKGVYEAASLASEGFIHASKNEQVKGVLERYYAGRSHLVLLHIKEKMVTSPVQYEMAPSVNELFPHIYGPLNLDAVVEVTEI